MTTTLNEANEILKAAVAERLASTPVDDPKMVGYKPQPQTVVVGHGVLNEWAEFVGGEPADDPTMTGRERKACQDSLRESYAEWRPPAYATSVAEQTLQAALEAVRDRHTKYGPPNEHFNRTAALVNAAFGTTFTAADWALVMVLDKVARLRGPTPTTDGGVDIAGYGGCYEECRSRG